MTCQKSHHLPFDYSLFPPVLTLITAALIIVCFVVLLAVSFPGVPLAVIPALNLASSDAAAVAGLVMTVLTVGLVSCAGKSLPRFWPGDFFPVFYACHLAVLGVLAL